MSEILQQQKYTKLLSKILTKSVGGPRFFFEISPATVRLKTFFTQEKTFFKNVFSYTPILYPHFNFHDSLYVKSFRLHL